MSLLPFCEWLASTPGSIALHESLFMYPLVESVHVLTLCLFVGMTMMLDLRLTGSACPRRPRGLQRPDRQVVGAGIPVRSPTTPTPRTARLAYVGQDLYGSWAGQMGKRIVELVGAGKVGLVHRHAGQLLHPAPHRRRAAGDRGVRSRIETSRS